MPIGRSRCGFFGFLRRGRGRLEADVREEHQRRAADDAGPAVFFRPLVFRNERMPVVGIHVVRADDDHDDDQRHLEDHHREIRAARFLDADVADPGQRQHDRDRGQVEQCAGRDEMVVGERERRIGQRRRQVDAEVIEQAREIAGPADRDGRCRDAVFEHHVPADEPGDELAERRVRIRVRAAGHRDQRRELGVAERREAAADRRHDEAEHDRRARVLGRGLSRDHEDAAADHGADAERGQSPRSERALEARAFAGVRVGEIGFLREKSIEHR